MIESMRRHAAPVAVAHGILVALATASGCAQVEDDDASEPAPGLEAQVASASTSTRAPPPGRGTSGGRCSSESMTDQGKLGVPLSPWNVHRLLSAAG